jgi:DNA-binding NtrC family response regulator
VIHVTLPPLRDRSDEIPLLLAYYADEAAEALKRGPVAMTPRLRNYLLRYPYPGNIRELRNIMYRLSCLAGEMADLSHLPEDIRPATQRGGAARAGVSGATDSASLAEAKRAASDEAERSCLERGLQEVGGSVSELARRWDMNRSHLQILLKKHGLHSKDFRKQA